MSTDVPAMRLKAENARLRRQLAAAKRIIRLYEMALAFAGLLQTSTSAVDRLEDAV